MEKTHVICFYRPLQSPRVETGKNFLETNYQAGNQIIIYGYSYGGDNAINFSKRNI